MEQVKVLSAALALREFTVDELSALSGVRANSVRSVLNRNPQLVDRIGSAQPAGRGRPSNKWAVADSAASRQLADDLNTLVAADPSTLSNIDERPSTVVQSDRREIAVSVAERALAQVIDEQDFDVQREIITSAQASLSYADDARESSTGPHWWREDSSSLAVRARAVDALATLAATPQKQLSDDLLGRTAWDVAAAMDAVPTRGDAVYFAPFSQVLAAHETLAPVLWMSDRDAPPSRVSDHWSILRTSGVDLNDAHVHTQSWATPLIEVAAPMPMLLSSTGPAAPTEEFVRSLLERTRTIPRPALVLGRARQTGLPLIAARWGASFVPMDWRSSKGFQRAVNAVAAAIDRHVAPDLLEVATVETNSGVTT